MKYGHRPYKCSEETLERARQYYHSLSDAAKERHKKRSALWQKNNPDKVRQMQRDQQLRRIAAGEWKCSAGLTKEEWRMYRMFLRLSEGQDL